MPHNYLKLLQDRRWQRRRPEIMQRDNWTCLRCGCVRNEVQLHVHHLRYPWKDYVKHVLAQPWECPAKDLETLCEPCHLEGHGKPCKRLAAPSVGVIKYSDLLRDRQLGETAAAFEAKRNKVLSDLKSLSCAGGT